MAETLNPLYVVGTRQPPPSGASAQNPVDGNGSRDLVEWVAWEATSSKYEVGRASRCTRPGSRRHGSSFSGRSWLWPQETCTIQWPL